MPALWQKQAAHPSRSRLMFFAATEPLHDASFRRIGEQGRACGAHFVFGLKNGADNAQPLGPATIFARRWRDKLSRLQVTNSRNGQILSLCTPLVRQAPSTACRDAHNRTKQGRGEPRPESGRNEPATRSVCVLVSEHCRNHARRRWRCRVAKRSALPTLCHKQAAHPSRSC